MRRCPPAQSIRVEIPGLNRGPWNLGKCANRKSKSREPPRNTQVDRFGMGDFPVPACRISPCGVKQKTKVRNRPGGRKKIISGYARVPPGILSLGFLSFLRLGIDSFISLPLFYFLSSPKKKPPSPFPYLFLSPPLFLPNLPTSPISPCHNPISMNAFKST